jgi:hypothetical protein
LPHSDGCFVKAYPDETAEAFCDGHVAAFDFFGGVPRSILYDNTRLAVARIVKGGQRLRSHMFAELQSHYLFEDRFGRPGKGNDKGKVEGLVGYVRRNFMTPLPVAESFDALNARFLDACMKRRQAVLRGQTATIGERMQADAAAFLPLPAAPYDALPQGRHPRLIPVAGALPQQRLFGSDALRPSRSSGEGICRPGRDRLPRRDDRHPRPQL